MKANNRVIIYDNTCPMCSAYTRGFIRSGLLREENRISFAELNDQPFIRKIDMQRAKHEIPLTDPDTGETIYGLDALVYILSTRFSIIGNIMSIRPVHWFFKRLYALISFNRRIIVPAEKQIMKYDSTPDLNMKYRATFIFFAIAFSSLITWWFGRSTVHYANITGGGMQMLFIAGTGWVLQLTAVFFFAGRKRLEYAGHLAVLMIIGVLLLIPGILIAALTQYRFIPVPLISVLLSSAIMLRQHHKRIQHLKMSNRWTVSWFLSLQLTAAAWTYYFYLS